MKSALGETIMGRVLGVLARSVCRHRWLFFWPQLVLLVLCVFYTCHYLEFDTDRDDLVGSQKKYHQIFLQYKKEFPAQDDLVVVVESENAEKNRQFVERLGRKLEVETRTFTDVFYKGDLSVMGRKALLFASESDLKEMQEKLVEFLPFIRQFETVTNLNSLFSMVNSQIYHAKHEANAQNDALLKAFPMLNRIVGQAALSLSRPGAPPSPGIYALFGDGDKAEQSIYITYMKGGRHVYLVTARAKTKELNDAAVERLRELVRQTSLEIPGVNVGVTGESVLEHDEMRQSQLDSTKASIISLVLCALIFIYGYQETGRPLKATFCLLVGLGYTMAFTTLVVGHLNILTITFVPILIGLAIDFGVHLITRYEEELRLGKSERVAMHMAIVYTGQGILSGAMTTAVAFLAMGLTDFKGIQEMGIICGGGMILCFIPMMTMLPVLLFRGTQNTLDHQLPVTHVPSKISQMRARIESLWLRRPLVVTLLTLAITGVAATCFHRVYFDYNLLHMQSAGLPAVVYEQKLIDTTPQSVLFAAVVVNTPEEALELEKKLSALPAVATNISMAPYVTGDQREKLRLIGEIKREISTVDFHPADTAPADIYKLSSTLYSTQGYMGAAAEAVQEDETNKPAAPIDLKQKSSDTGVVPGTATNDEPDLAGQMLGLRDTINDFRRKMLGMDETAAAAKLAEFQQALLNDVRGTFDTIKNQDNSSALKLEDLPESLRDRFVGVHGKLLIQVYPKGDAWDHGVQEEFIKQVRTVVPTVTGTPVQLLEYETLLRTSYVKAAQYSLIFIVLMVLFHFRSFAYLILALLPVAIGAAWMGGCMGAFGIPFNPANIMTLPLVIGIGVTNGIHILNRYAEEGNPAILSKSTGKAVFVSGLTTMSGFGSLILGKHLGIRSLGEVMSLGMLMCMIAALAFLPAVLKLTGSWLKAPTKQPSGDNARSTLGREEPR